MIGQSALRIEDRPLLLGRASFAGDVRLPGQTYMRVVRSQVAHGLITSIDTSGAKALPGVIGVWTANEVNLPDIEFRQVAFPEMLPYRQPVLARDRVRYVGEPIAIIVAESAYIAEDAEELVEVTITDLPVVVDPCAPPSPFDDINDTEALKFEFEYGDTEAQFAEAAQIVELTVRVGRHSGVPMECRGAVADYNEGDDSLRLYGAAKVPHYNRDALSAMLGMSPSRITLIELHVGGGFGIRGELYPEDALVCWASRAVGRPVSWSEDRREHLMSANHSRDQLHKLRAAVDADGFIRALEDEFWLDQGAYVRTHAATVPTLTASMLPGPYVIPHYRVTSHVRLTNKTPAGTYRAPGRYEGTFARERLIDAIAHQLRLNPMAVRSRNFISPEDMPFSRPLEALGTQVEYDSGKYQLMVDKAEKVWNLPEVEREIEIRRDRGELVGIGRAFFVEKSGLGPFEGVRVTIDESGATSILTGGASVGQGFETVMAQVCADVLDTGIDNMQVLHGNTSTFEYGMGAFASRLSVMAGTATHMAAHAVLDKAKKVFARTHEVNMADIECFAGGVRVIGDPDTHVSFGSIAQALRPVAAARLGMSPGLTSEQWFFSEHMNYPYGYHAGVVSIDPETFGITVEAYWIAYDIGKAINPMLVEGQIVGGAAQGLGGALLEDFRYDEAGQPLCTSFLDYLMPTAAEMPPIKVLITEDAPSPLNPLGLKGAGEGGTTAFGAAVASAVDHALSDFVVLELPVTPSFVRSWIRGE